jgi:serine/threonine protein kinase
MPQYTKKDLRDVIPEASEEAVKLIGLLLRYNADYRPNAEEIMSDPYFEDVRD